VEHRYLGSISLLSSFCARYLQDLVWRLALFKQVLSLGLERAGWAHAHALSAEYARRLGHGFVEECPNLGFESPAFEIDGEGVLGILRAYLDTAPA
jgi:hypothetical protein